MRGARLYAALAVVVGGWTPVDPALAQAAPGRLGTIVGKVALQTGDEGTRPPRYYRGRYRAAHGTDGLPAPLQSVVVFVEGLTSPPSGWTLPAEPIAMRQDHDRFVPHVLPVLAGSTVTFPNHDNYFHNVFSVVAGDRFDLGRYGQGDTREQVFAEPAVVVVRCEIHPGMKAYILVRDNPHFAVPDANGRFRLDGVPAGGRSVTAWHPTRGQQSLTAVVAPGPEATVDFSF
jgi:plastocyanin